MKSVWSEYKSRFGVANQNLNGKLFELILATVLIREDILPFYVSVEVAFVPNVVYDLMVHDCAAGPVCISAKTSLRERYKQADLEAYVLKNVHRRAKYYLVTLNHEEADSLKSKLQAGELIGIDRVVIADSTEFDELVATLKELNLCAPPKVDVFTGASSVTTEKVEHLRKRPSTR
ncbi:MAG: hypothetical protein RMM31_00220 [Anaerolineae bacterium]|nr:hypothetical protein [Anaerolineae bacterium]